MAENKKELEWKNHMPFFSNLNEDLKYLKLIASNRDMRNQQPYYQALEDFKTHYCIYVKNNSIVNKLTEVRRVLYSTKYPRKEWDKVYYKEVLDAMDLLRDIHEDLILGVYNSQLIPQFNYVDTTTPAAARNGK